MKIWVDADNCSSKIKDIILRASERLCVKTIFVANVELELSSFSFAESIFVEIGSDAADNKILSLVEKGDIVITADIPFAAKVLEKETVVINPRGDHYTAEKIKERLSLRNFISNLRDMGMSVESNKMSNTNSVKKFSEIFDRELTKAIKLYGN